MKPYFTEIAKNEIKVGFFFHQINLFLKPFKTVSDFLWTFGLIAISPCYFVTLFCLVLMELILITGATLYAFVLSNSKKVNSYLSESLDVLQTSFSLFIVFIFSAPVMVVTFLTRMLASSGLMEATFFDKPSSPHEDSLILLASYKKYRKLLDKVNHDRGIIINEMRSFNNHVDYLRSEYLINESKTREMCFFSHSGENIRLRGPAVDRRLFLMSVRSELDRLMNNYPFLNCSDSIKSIEVEEVFNKLEYHHSQVIDVADIYLKELTSLLNEAKPTNTYNI